MGHLWMVMNLIWDMLWLCLMKVEVWWTISTKGQWTIKIEIWYFFTQIIKYTAKKVLMDGDISQIPLRFASSFGKTLYVRNNNNETNKEMHVINNPAKWEDEMYKDIEHLRTSTRTSGSALYRNHRNNVWASLWYHEETPKTEDQDVNRNRQRNHQESIFENINKTLETCNVLIFSPVFESALIFQYQWRRYMEWWVLRSTRKEPSYRWVGGVGILKNQQ